MPGSPSKTARPRRLLRRRPVLRDPGGLRTEATLQAVLDAVKESVWLFNQDGVCILGNETALRRFGRPVEQIIGRPIMEVTGPDPGLQRMARLREVVATGCPLETFDERAGISFHHFWYPVLDDQGRVAQVATFSYDITARKRAEATLRESEARFRAVLENSRDVLYRLNLKTRQYDYISPAAESLVGYTPDELMAIGGDQGLGQIHPDDREVFRCLPEHADGSIQMDLVYRQHTKGGDYRWVSNHVTQVYDQDGQPLYRYGNLRDITGRKQLEESLQRSERLYRSIGESIPYGVWVCDPDGRNTYASDSFLKMVGLTQEACSSFGWGTVLHPDDRERTLAAWQECVRSGGEWNIEHRFRGVDGQWHHVLARGLPVRDEQGRISCWAGINLDIDKLKQMEEGLKEEVLRKDNFIALLGHELRNPLVPIGNAVYLMRRAGQDPALMDNACTIAERQLAHIARLVDDLLDVSRINRGKIQLKNEVIDLVQIMGSVVRDYQPVFAENNLALTIGLPPGPVKIDADKARMVQAVSNLLQNAIKFTDPGGQVSVSVGVQDTDWAEVTVKDSGTGIPAEALASIFEPFIQREETIGRTRGGLGLGLALAKGLVELHGGTLSAHSDGPGQGADFTVRLPLVTVIDRPEQHAPSFGITESVPRRRILVVEDVPDAATTLKLLLELWGHTAAVALDGRTGLDKADSFHPEIILCDLGLPGEPDGFGVARAIRRTPGLEKVHLVAMTGFGSAGAREKAMEAGFDLHLVKPVEPEALAQVIDRLHDMGKG